MNYENQLWMEKFKKDFALTDCIEIHTKTEGTILRGTFDSSSVNFYEKMVSIEEDEISFHIKFDQISSVSRVEEDEEDAGYIFSYHILMKDKTELYINLY